jgi:hypothetical protein
MKLLKGKYGAEDLILLRKHGSKGSK